jgi:DNA-binding CsgD family transcriptional regulator
VRRGEISTDLIGRKAELELLVGILDSAATGSMSTVLVSGEAGVGKTRLVRELCGIAANRDHRVASGATSSIDGPALPYGPVVALLRDLHLQLAAEQASELLGPALRALGLPGAEVGDDADRTVSKPGPGSFAKTWLYEVIYQGLIGASRSRPTVLVLEDLHWADAATLGFIEFLNKNATACPLLVIGTYRTDELGTLSTLHGFVSEMTRSSTVVPIRLNGLGEGDVATLLGSILGHRPTHADVASMVVRSAGNPFFIEELVVAGQSGGVPFTLGEVIRARVNSLSDSARSLLANASAVGTDIDHALLAEIIDLDPADLAMAFSELVASHHLVVNSRGDGYRFRHELLREVVYGSMLPGERAVVHRRIATAIDTHRHLASAGGTSADVELARHWWRAGDWARAFASALVAAGEAEAVFAFDEALTHLDHALASLERLSPGSVGPRDHVTLLERAADVAYFAGSRQRAVELAREVLANLDAGVDPLLRAMAYVRLSRAEWGVSDQEEAFRALEKAEALVPAAPATVVLARVLAEKARSLMLVSRMEAAESVCHRALAAAVAAGARSEEGHVVNTLGVCRGALGHGEEAVALLHSALDIAHELGSVDDTNRAFSNLSQVLYQAGRLNETADMAQRIRQAGDELGGIRLQSAVMNCGDALIDLGRWHEAEDIFVNTGAVMGNCGNHPALSLSLIATREGRLADASAMLTVLGQGTERLTDLQFRGAYHIRRAELMLEEKCPARAYEEIEQGLSLAATSDDDFYVSEMYALGVRAVADSLEMAREAGRRREESKYQALVTELVDAVTVLESRPEARGGCCAPRTVAFAAQCRAEQSRISGSDPELWDRAAQCWERLGQPFETSYCRWRQAEAWLVRRSCRARAVDTLQQAWLTSVDLGAKPLRSRIEALAQRARAPLAHETARARLTAQVSSDLGLTPREVEVLTYLASGCRDAEIAESLFISKKTASVHVSNLLRKLDAENRHHAGEIGRHAGLVSATADPGSD